MSQNFALFGSPISSSPSPRMHEAAFKALGIDADYSLRPATLADISEIKNELESGLWNGCNVTTPLKIELAKHFQLEGAAQKARALNTIYGRNNSWLGALTDVEGVQVPLQRRGIQKGDALVIGAGGAARAACLALEKLGMRVHVSSRRPEPAQAALGILAPVARGTIIGLDKQKELRELLEISEVIIQATPLGRNGEMHEIPWERLSKNAIAFEMLYQPRTTPFLAKAVECGLETIEGWEMLLHQGICSFTKWTGREAPEEVMRRALCSSFLP